jgi:hypothetical protein
VRLRAAATRVGLLALLLVLSLAQATGAALSIYQRASVVSWDNPISQHNDELASQAVPWADPAEESLAHARAAAQATGRLVALPTLPDLGSPALCSGITRSPPIA